MAEKSRPLPFEAELRDEDPETRKAAASELVEGRHPAVPSFLLALKYEKSRAVRIHLADSLAQLDNLAALPELIEGMRIDEHAQSAGLISMRILARNFRAPGEAPSYRFLCDELAMLHRSWLRRGHPPRSVGVTVDERTKAQLARHFVNLEGFQLRPVDDARFVLSRFGVGVVPLLQMALQAKETHLRQHAMEVLCGLGHAGRSARPQVQALLRDPLSCAQAARTLGELGDQIAVPHLLKLRDDEDLEIRCAAAGALGPLGDQRGSEPLRRLLESTDEPLDLQVWASFSLALLDPGGRGLAFLLERLESDDYHRPTVEELIERIGRIERE
jgi:HEAT repeat protein